MICERIKEARIKTGKTAREASILLGISQPHYFDIEHGKRIPSLAVISHIAEIYNVSLDWLVYGENKVTNM